MKEYNVDEKFYQRKYNLKSIFYIEGFVLCRRKISHKHLTDIAGLTWKSWWWMEWLLDQIDYIEESVTRPEEAAYKFDSYNCQIPLTRWKK